MNLWLEKEVGPTEVLVLVSNESVLSNRLDLTIVLDTYIQNIITKKSMITKTYNFLWYNYCDIISIAIENGYQLTKVSVLIDRLPSLIESCSSTNSSSTTNITSSTTSSTFSSTSFSSNDIDSLYNLLLVLMNQNSLTITESITKVLTKFTTCATKLIQRENYYNGLQLLKILVSSNYRSLLILSANHVRQVCYTVINSVNCNNYGYSNSNCNSSNKSNSTSNKNNNSSSNNRNSVSTVSIDIIQLLTDVITMYTSIDNTEIWIDLWKTIVNDCNLLLSKLGLNVRETESQTNKTILPNLDVFNSVGFERANGIRKVFSILCTLLQKMLLMGCSSGTVTIDYVQFLVLWNSVLNTSFDIQITDPVSYVLSDSNVSPADLALVGNQLKIDLMAVMNRLLSTHHQGMGRVGTAVFHPLISLLGRKECSTIPGLLLNTISTIKTTIPVFPYLIANYLNNGSTFLIDLLRDELQYLISNRSMVSSQPEQCTAVTTTRTSAVDINGNIEFKDVQAVTSKSKSVTTAARTFVGCNKEARRELQILLLETLEVLLLFCGSALSATLREIIEILLGQTMSCMTKGLVLPQFSDRRMHRIDCELIRSDRKLQELVLRVATTEVSSIPSSGIMSGNTSILRKAAECCLLNSVTMTQAAKTLHYLSAVIHPTAVMIPSVTLSDATRTYLLASKEIAEKVRKDTEEIAAASGDNRVERDNFNPVDNDAKEMAVKVDVNASERKAISSKRKVETSKKLPAKKQQKTKTNKSVTLAASVTKAQVGIVAEIKASVSKATLQESDDESIPDIDMSAEPDH